MIVIRSASYILLMVKIAELIKQLKTFVKMQNVLIFQLEWVANKFALHIYRHAILMEFIVLLKLIAQTTLLNLLKLVGHKKIAQVSPMLLVSSARLNLAQTVLIRLVRIQF